MIRVFLLLGLAGLGLGAALGLVDQWWLTDLFSHFRLQYAVALAVLGALLLIVKAPRWAVAAFALSVLNWMIAWPPPFFARASGHSTAQAHRLLLLNVNTSAGRPELVRALIEAEQPELVVLLEVSEAWIASLESLSSSYPHRCIQPRPDNFGIALFSRLPLSHVQLTSFGDVDTPSIVAKVACAGGELQLIATHPLPPIRPRLFRHRNAQLSAMAAAVPSDREVILAGDLNVSPWSGHFRALLHRSGLRDSAEEFGHQPTWPSFIPLLRIPIDHCLHSSGVAIQSRRLGPNVGSDHLPVIVDFAVRESSTPARHSAN